MKHPSYTYIPSYFVHAFSTSHVLLYLHSESVKSFHKTCISVLDQQYFQLLEASLLNVGLEAKNPETFVNIVVSAWLLMTKHETIKANRHQLIEFERKLRLEREQGFPVGVSGNLRQ